MANTHAFLAPSSASRRIACPASAHLTQQFPGVSGPEAEEGDRAHSLAAVILKRANGDMYDDIDFIPSEEMKKHVKIYTDAVLSISNHSLHIEEYLSLKVIHELAAGTPDCWFFNGGELYIWDFKYGFGHVEVFENWQMIAYAAGIINKLRVEGHDISRLWVNFHIVQPRDYSVSTPIRAWRANYIDLQKHFAYLQEAEKRVFQFPNDYGVSKECRYCPARAACPGLEREAARVIDTAYIPTDPGINEEFLGEELKALQEARDVLDARITGLEEEALARLRNGKPVSHFRIGNGRSSQVWSRPNNEVETLGKALGFNLMKSAPITPKQAIAVGMPDGIVKSFSEVIPGKLKLERLALNDIRKLLTKPSK